MRFKLRCFGKVLLVLVGIAVLGWMVMTLWNWVVPALFIGGRSIDYLHAMGLLILSRILFGGFRGHGGCRGRRHWRRWERMTPEERENFQKNLSSADGKRREDQA
ncbi:hypothetical protein [Paraburkholderia domus]|uniref:hypothetical protein n=1 Tax=Paraburkholderia domus TaxID=2793075 RepID=UPI0019137092|nr:hypothetical protein [Paraburkholderia domus]MBK5061928.1 hypothetical protein [Burkholderia sp. R-70199]CAE6886880.1 hypothetical protein R70199_02869 [Paraburkholderia domus]